MAAHTQQEKENRLPQLRRSLSRRSLDIVVPILIATRLTPNQLTLIGVGIAFAAAALAAMGHLFSAGALVLVGAAFDMFDGALARATNRSSVKGAFLDSNLDRVAEAAVLFGVLVYAERNGLTQVALLTFLAMVGSLLVSYVKARAEGLGFKCDVGIFTRTERVLLIAVALLIGQLLIPLYILAVLSLFTALHRFWHVWRRG